MVIMFSDMNMFHVSDILKKNVVEFTFKRKHFFQMFFALFSRATRLSACKKLAEFPIKSLWIRERWLNMQDYSRLYVAWVLYICTLEGTPPTEFNSLKNYIWMFNLFVSLGLICITCQNTLLIIVKTKVGVKSISKVKLNENMPYYDHGWQYLVVYIYTSQSRGPFNKDL